MSHTDKPDMFEEAARWAYSLLWLMLLPLVLLHALILSLMGKNKYGIRFVERLGVIPATQRQGGILIHCVSVGEVVVASQLLKKMMQQSPSLNVTITTTTPTGSARVKDIFGDTVSHFYLPLDLPFLMRRMLNKVKPDLVIITEVELWPNLIHCGWKKSIPVCVINARMTAKSLRSYSKLSLLMTPLLRKLSLVCAQAKRDYDNYLKLGISSARLKLTNNMKFDISASADEQVRQALNERFNPLSKPVFLAGSTHDPEEQVILNTFAQLRRTFPELLLLLVPRHPQRFEKVWQLCQQSGLRAERSSVGISAQCDVVLVDEMGMLADLYSIARVAFVGGSFATRGGHNALEAAVYGVPAIMGPSTYNNPDICQALQQAGALRITESADTLADAASLWLSDDDAHARAADAGRKVVTENAGAIDLTQTELTSLLEARRHD